MGNILLSPEVISFSFSQFQACVKVCKSNLYQSAFKPAVSFKPSREFYIIFYISVELSEYLISKKEAKDQEKALGKG